MSDEKTIEEVVEVGAPIEESGSEHDTTKKRGRKPAEKKLSQEEIQAVLQTPEAQAIMQSMVAQMLAAQKPAVVQVSAQKEEMVTLLYMGAVSEGSTVSLGDKLGTILGRGGTRTISKTVFFENMTPSVLNRLKDRRLIVLDGLTDEERERYGVNYSDGELVGKEIYYKLLELHEDTVVKIFTKACFRHKQLIAALYADAYSAGDNRVNQPLIQKLNKASKAVDKAGMFTAILKDMAKSLGDDSEEENDE